MKLGSLFDGIGGFPLAGMMHGIEPVWASEIEPFPIAVTKKRFPNMKHLGSVTDINGAEIEPVDVITFRSPCQDLSVAGAKKGIHDGERSSLFFVAIRIIKEMRASDRASGRADEYCRPRFAVWENVPGAFSSNKGSDFQAVLQAICEIADAEVHVPFPEKGKWQPAGCIVGDGYSVAWRVYDAQYWGVPQRRKRIYLVADFASERAGEILFEREGMRGDSETSGEAREGIAEDAEGSAGRGCGAVVTGFDAYQHHGWRESNTLGSLNYQNPVVYDARGNGEGGVSPTMTGDHQNRVTDYTAIAVYDTTQITSPLNYSNPQPGAPCHPLASQQHPPLAVCAGNGQLHNATMKPVSNSLDCMHDQQMIVSELKQTDRRYIVRRLTPLECCRLQGYPDGWTENLAIENPTDEQIDFFAKVWALWAAINGTKPKSRNQVIKWLQDPQSDSAEYKAYGNSLAIPCAADVIGRVARAMEEGADD